MAAAAETIERPPAEPPGPLRLTAVALLFAGVGAVSGLHVLGLLVGRAQFVTTRRIEDLIGGLDLRRCLLPTAAVDRAAWLETWGLIGRQPWLVALTALAVLAAVLALIHVLNPRLLPRLRDGSVGRGRVIGAAAATGLVLALAVVPLPGLGEAVGWLRAAVAGAVIWLLWHQRGWLHPSDGAPPRVELVGHLISGALTGLLAHLMLRHTLTLTDLQVLGLWLGGGFWSDQVWDELTRYAVAGRAIGGLAVGTLIVLLGQSHTQISARRWRAAPAILLLAIALLVAEGQRRRWVAEADWGLTLAEQLELPAGPPAPPEPRVLLVLGDGPLAGRLLSDETMLQLPADEPVAAAVRGYLAGRESPGCLANDAYVQLHDAAAVEWQAAGMLAVQEAQLATPAASPMFMAVRLETLGRCPALPAAEAAVERLCDPSRYVAADPMAAETLLGLAWRWGKLPRVEALAGRVPEVWQRLSATPPPGREGRVSGRLVLDGAPLAQVRVGVIHAEDAPALTVPPPAPLGPWPQRWILAGTTTDDDGGFAVERLFDGEYRIVVALPERLWTAPGPLTVEAPTAITLDSETTEVDLGTLSIVPWQPPPPTVEARRGNLLDGAGA